ncbi:MAG TPA: hypothetical protein VKA26_01025 [Ignavibacteriaceae bacterium]|nr:hypothetical protein [Ignavibacteriaceae bacterium]
MTKTIILSLLMIGMMRAQTTANSDKQKFPLDSSKGLELVNVKAEPVNYSGKNGLQVTAMDGYKKGETLVIIPGVYFKDGVIELELTGEPAPGVPPEMRGFVGIAFHVGTTDSSNYECFYIRPTNGRADNQLIRNHSTQYISHPEYPWFRLRKESPGMYESYADMMPGEWTKFKIVVKGKTAKLFLHGSDQPCLVVNDLKHGITGGRIALWQHFTTLARYRNLVIMSE